VIGNSAYKGELPALPNPANDAKLMAKTLKGIGFDVVEAEDASQDEMKRAIAEFSDKLTAAGSEGTGLFFYAGHGVQVGGENYLIPIDAKIKKEADVDLVAVSASTVLKQMDFAGSAVNIIILDACRNNPLGDGARGMTRGLAEIKSTPRGSFIAYSTAPGSTAADGNGANSPYTTALAQTITEPGLSISDVFQEVRSKVLASTGNQQTPWDSSSLTGRFYFTAPDTTQMASVTPPPAAATTPAPPTVDELAVEKTYWDSVKDSTDADDFNDYLARYPNGLYVERAKAKLAELKGGGTQVASAETSGNSAAGQTVRPPQATEVSFVAQNQTVYAKGGGQVRAAPGADAAMLAKLQPNTEVEATGLSSDEKWWRVTLPDGRTGYMHRSVVSEQAFQTASAAPAQPADNAGTATRTLGADALEPVNQPAAQVVAPNGADVASQVLQGFLQSAAEKAGLPGVNIQGSQQQQTQTASVDMVPINETIKLRAGTTVFNAAGGQPIWTLKQGGPLLAIERSSDGRWYHVSLPTGQTGYVPRQSVVK
jgi:carboxyl-terminal processing protease